MDILRQCIYQGSSMMHNVSEVWAVVTGDSLPWHTLYFQLLCVV